VGEALQRVHDETSVVETLPTVVALEEVRTKRGDAESGLAVDQQVDLVGEQVSMVHVASGPCTDRG
jgi:hypothetical protein